MDEECQNIRKEFMQKMKELEFDLKQKFEEEKSGIEQSYKTKICEMEKDLKDQFETEKGEDRKNIENSYQQKIKIMEQLHANEKQTLKKLHYDELQALKKQQIESLESLSKQLNDDHQKHISLTKSHKNGFSSVRNLFQKKNKQSIKCLQQDFEKKLKFVFHTLNICHQDEINQLNSMFQNDVSALQMAHHEQFQRLAEDMRRHWEVEKSKLQKLHAEEIEAMKENFNRGLKHKKHIKEEIQHTMQQNQEEELKMFEKLFKQKVDNLQELLRNSKLFTCVKHLINRSLVENKKSLFGILTLLLLCIHDEG
ncbi:uncharacterized protein LOC143248343 [Tachypleus tridentatus]|uniref:uncharacterized protein LOC143248343 n=1 Tax=Tachypleus tridentatus TaxID=6853 RepID=UPI003FD4F962